MRYDLVARFYRKADGAKAAYACPLGIYHESRMGNLENRGFGIDPDSTPGYLDYIKRDSSVEELQELTREGYVSEVMDVLYDGESEGGYERIELSAMEIETIDDEGTVPPSGVFLGGTFVQFQSSEPEAPVTFIDGDPYEANANTRTFQVSLGRLKEYFDVLTLYEVRDRLKKDFDDPKQWPFERLEYHFEPREDDAVELLVQREKFEVQGGTYEPYLLHCLQMGMKGKTKYERMAGFLLPSVTHGHITLEELRDRHYADELIDAFSLILDNEQLPFRELIDIVCGSGNGIAPKLLQWSLEFFASQCRKVGENEDADRFQGHLDYLTEKMAELGMLGGND